MHWEETGPKRAAPKPAPQPEVPRRRSQPSGRCVRLSRRQVGAAMAAGGRRRCGMFARRAALCPGEESVLIIDSRPKLCCRVNVDLPAALCYTDTGM